MRFSSPWDTPLHFLSYHAPPDDESFRAIVGDEPFVDQDADDRAYLGWDALDEDMARARRKQAPEALAVARLDGAALQWMADIDAPVCTCALPSECACVTEIVALRSHRGRVADLVQRCLDKIGDLTVRPSALLRDGESAELS